MKNKVRRKEKEESWKKAGRRVGRGNGKGGVCVCKGEPRANSHNAGGHQRKPVGPMWAERLQSVGSESRRALPSSEKIKVFHSAQVLEKRSCWFRDERTKSSSLLTSLILCIHIPIVGGCGDFHRRGMHASAASRRGRMMDFFVYFPRDIGGLEKEEGRVIRYRSFCEFLGNMSNLLPKVF